MINNNPVLKRWRGYRRFSTTFFSIPTFELREEREDKGLKDGTGAWGGMDCNEKRRGRMRIVMRREGKGCRRVEKV